MSHATYIEVTNRLYICKGIAIDDHVDPHAQLFQRFTHIKGVAMTKNGEHVVSVDPNGAAEPYSINKLYIGSDGMVHISKTSVGIIQPGHDKEIVTHVYAINFVFE